MFNILKYFTYLIKNIFFFNFSSPRKSNIVVFDGESLQSLKYTLEDYEYQIVESRKERIKNIYCSPKFIVFFFLNLIKLSSKRRINLLTVYLYTAIKMTEPKIVITSICNSTKFSELARLFEEKINFIAIQKANKYEYIQNDTYFKAGSMKENLNKRYYLPNYYVFGDMEEEKCKKFQINVGKFYKYGSIQIANFFEYIKNNKITLNKNKYDLCCIEDGDPYLISSHNNQQLSQKVTDLGYMNLLKFTVIFAKKNNLKFIYLKKRNKGHRSEFKVLRKMEQYLSKEYVNYIKENTCSRDTDKNFYNNYQALFESKVAIGVSTTMLREKLGCRNKILSCNLTGADVLNFPINGICSLINSNYNEFEERLSKILEMSEEDYFKNINRPVNQLVNFDKNSSMIYKLKKDLDNYLIN